MELEMKRIGENIREARKAAGMLQKDLAEKIGIARTSIPGIEKGLLQSINIDTLNAISHATGIGPCYLLGCDIGEQAMEAIREHAPELASQIEREGIAGLTDKECRAIVRIILE